MLEVVTRVRNSSERKTAISSRYKPGFQTGIRRGLQLLVVLQPVSVLFELGVRAHFQIPASMREYL
jgi:hypothetical protein